MVLLVFSKPPAKHHPYFWPHFSKLFKCCVNDNGLFQRYELVGGFIEIFLSLPSVNMASGL